MKYLLKYFSFKGRATRKEYFWYWVILLLGATIAVNFEQRVLKLPMEEMPFFGTWAALNFIPVWSISIRRLHDMDKSAWWVFVNTIPFFGNGIFMLWAGLSPGTKGANKYGQEPI